MKLFEQLTGAAVVAMALAASAQATLIDRGNGLIYDTELNITWMQNANAAGRLMNWVEAKNWASDLVFAGYDDWRLPKSSYLYWQYGYDGTTSGGYNVTTTEMSHLYYLGLGNKGFLDTSGAVDPNYGLKNVGPFENVQRYWYWSETRFIEETSSAWYFTFSYGDQNSAYLYQPGYAWAVRDGDSRVPDQGSTLLLLGAVLGGLAALRRCRPGRS